MKRSKNILVNHQKKKFCLNNSKKLMILTLAMLILILGVVNIRNFEWKNEKTIPVFILKDEVGVPENNALNSNENKILSMISANPIKVTGDKNNLQSLYMSTLTQHLAQNNIDLGEEQVNAVSELLLNLNKSMGIKDNKEEEKMSLINRGVVLSVSQQIYEQCGLNLHYNIAGEIKQIREVSGKILYDSSKDKVQSELKWNIFIIILFLCVLLISVSIIVSRHQQLFKKGGYTHGYKEKEFA